MPIQFACTHCDQRLSVSRKKVGAEFGCPQCKALIVVPDEQRAAAILAERRRRRDGESDDSPAEEELPFSQFAVFDDEPEIVYEHEIDTHQEAQRSQQEARVDPSRVALPRLVIYFQGGLLAVVALMAFVLGIMFGGLFGGTGSTPPSATGPHTIDGALYFQAGDNATAPEVDALVLALPVNAKPAERPTVEGIGPEDPPPKDDNTALLAIRQVGGDYTRTNATGKFSLNVPSGGRYHLLFISQERKRGGQDSLNPTVLAQLGGYLLDPQDLFKNRAYEWRTEMVRSNRTLTHVFD